MESVCRASGRRRATLGLLLGAFWGALFTLPLGHFIVPGLLGGMGLCCHKGRSMRLGWDADAAWLVSVLLLQMGTWSLAGLWHDEAAWGLGTAAAIGLALPAASLLRRRAPAIHWLWGGMALGGISSGAWALWQRLVEGVLRAHGHPPLDAILFGNLALLTGLSCLAGLWWASSLQHRRGWVLWLIGGALGGLSASLLSGSRGGWIGLPLALWVLYRGPGSRLDRRWCALGLVGVLAAIAGLYALPQTGVAARVDHAVASLASYVQGGDELTSISARIELWRGALGLIVERPWLGWGQEGYLAAKANLIEAGRLPAELTAFQQSHNDLLDAWVKRGLPGLLALLALYGVPLWRFGRGLRDATPRQGSLAVAGMLLSVAFMDFGLTYGFLSDARGMAVYATWLVMLWALYRNGAGSPGAAQAAVRQ